MVFKQFFFCLSMITLASVFLLNFPVAYGQSVSSIKRYQAEEGVMVLDTAAGEKKISFTIIGPYNLTYNPFPLSILSGFMARENCESKVEYGELKKELKGELFPLKAPTPAEEAIYKAFNHPGTQLEELMDLWFESPCPGQTEKSYMYLKDTFRELYKTVNLFYREEKIDFFELPRDLQIIVSRKNLKHIIFLLGNFRLFGSAEINISLESNSLLYINAYFNGKFLDVKGEGEAFVRLLWNDEQGSVSFDLSTFLIRHDRKRF